MIIHPVYAKPINNMAYKNKYGFGQVTGVYGVKPNDDLEYRLCFQLTYPDGFVDYIPFQDSGYEIYSGFEKTLTNLTNTLDGIQE